MKLIPLKCTECLGIANYNSAQKTAKCEHCKRSFIVEEAPDNTYVLTVIEGGGGITADSLIDFAFILLKDKEFVKAAKYFEDALQRSPHSHQAHWGMLMTKLELSSTSDRDMAALVKRLYRVNLSADASEDVGAFATTICHPHYKNAVYFAKGQRDTRMQRLYESWFVKLMDMAARHREAVTQVVSKREMALTNKAHVEVEIQAVNEEEKAFVETSYKRTKCNIRVH